MNLEDVKKYDDADDADSGDDLDSSDSDDDSGDDEEALEKELEKIRKEREEARKKKVHHEPRPTTVPRSEGANACKVPCFTFVAADCRHTCNQSTSVLLCGLSISPMVGYPLARTRMPKKPQ